MEADPLNTLALIVGAVAGFIFGAIIYHPKVLGNVWARGVGMTEISPPPKMAFVFQIIALVALAAVIALTATIHALVTAILAIFAAIFFVMGSGLAKGHSTGAISTDGLYVFGAGALMIAAQGVL